MKKIEMRVYCSKCGDILEVSQPNIVLGDFTLLVVPCKTCVRPTRRAVDGGGCAHKNEVTYIDKKGVERCYACKQPHRN